DAPPRISTRGSRQPSLDHLVGAGQQRRRNFEAERLRGLEIDYQLVPSRCLHRQVARLLALQDAIDIAGGAPELFDGIRTIGNQAPIGDMEAIGIDCRHDPSGGGSVMQWRNDTTFPSPSV